MSVRVSKKVSVRARAVLLQIFVMTLEAIRYGTGSLQILNQLLLPHQTVYEEIRGVQAAYEAIKAMKVRGGPRHAWASLCSRPPRA